MSLWPLVTDSKSHEALGSRSGSGTSSYSPPTGSELGWGRRVLEVALSSQSGRASTNQASLLALTPPTDSAQTQKIFSLVHLLSSHFFISSVLFGAILPRMHLHTSSHSLLLFKPFQPSPVLASPSTTSPSLHTQGGNGETHILLAIISHTLTLLAMEPVQIITAAVTSLPHEHFRIT